MANHTTDGPTEAYVLAPVGPAGADWKRAVDVGIPAGMPQPARLTRRQVQVVGFVADHTRRYGYAPSLREISAHLGLSPDNVGSVFRHVAGLVGKGLLTRSPRPGAARARSIAIAAQRREAG